MLTAIVAADPRLFAKLGGSRNDPDAVYGIGYDADGDGEFAIDDDTVFDAEGFAFTSPADLATSHRRRRLLRRRLVHRFLALRRRASAQPVRRQQLGRTLPSEWQAAS